MHCLHISNQFMARTAAGLSSNQCRGTVDIQNMVFLFCQFCQTFNLPTQQNHIMNMVPMSTGVHFKLVLLKSALRYINSRNEQTVQSPSSPNVEKKTPKTPLFNSRKNHTVINQEHPQFHHLISFIKRHCSTRCTNNMTGKKTE